MLGLQMLFFHYFIGKHLTENVGFGLGALSFALLWRGAHRSCRRSLLMGLLAGIGAGGESRRAQSSIGQSKKRRLASGRGG